MNKEQSVFSIEEIIEKGTLIQTTVGYSMYPMLRNRRDNVLISKPKFPLKKYDVPLYKTLDNRYLLHRIIKVSKNGYVIRGDNTYEKEYGVKDHNIIGVLIGFYRGDKYYSVENKAYQFYIRLNMLFYPVRYSYYKLKRIASKIKKKLTKKCPK